MKTQNQQVPEMRSDRLQAEIDRLKAINAELVAAAKRALDVIHSLPYEPSNSASTQAQDALVDALAKAAQ